MALPVLTLPSQPAGAAPERALLDDCVHCGFCLPHCPTYLSWSEEMDSPRGRIDLMRSLRDGKTTLNAQVVQHFDACLGCMACVTACPSGVKYDQLIEETRGMIERQHTRAPFERFHRMMIFKLFPYPGRLRLAAIFSWLYARSGVRWLLRKSGLLRLLPRGLAAMEELQPDLPFSALAGTLPARTPAQGQRRATVALLAGCVQRVFFPGVNAASLRVLSAEGIEVLVPEGQGCCGALSMHSGHEPESLEFARALIAKFEAQPVDAILVNAAGCGSLTKEYGRLFAHDPAWAARAQAFSAKVRDISEYLAGLTPRAQRHPLAVTVAVHDACHLSHAQKIRAQPRQLLSGIPGLSLREIESSEQCCGSAGIYNLVQPGSAAEVGARKAGNVLAAGAQLLSSGNPGCTLQIQRHLRELGAHLPAAHPIEILDASLSGATPEALLARDARK